MPRQYKYFEGRTGQAETLPEKYSINTRAGDGSRIPRNHNHRKGDTMTYEKFIERYKARVHEELGCDLDRMKFYPAGYTTGDPVMLEWIRDTNLRYTGEGNSRLLTDILAIEVPESGTVGIQYSIAIRHIYNDGQKNGFEAIYEAIRNMRKDAGDVSVDEDRINARASGSYERIRDQLILRPLNYGLHIRDLRGCVYRKVNDFVLCLYQVLADTGQTLMTSKIKRNELEEWGVEEDVVMHHALENTARLYPPCVYDQRTRKEENFLEKEFTREDIMFQAPHGKLLTLSTFETNNGAVSLFYPGVIEKMLRIMGGPFQAVFMNTNDVLIFDKHDHAAYSFAKTAQGSTGLGEMLSGKIYMCDGKHMIPGIIVEVYPDGKVKVE